MKCFHCNGEINEAPGEYKITVPDGDCFHTGCLVEYEKERDHFFDDVIHDDTKFANWVGMPVSMIRG